jgi:4-amino-4-deoxy-L-arabinose transferase-like glycosyltransferase
MAVDLTPAGQRPYVGSSGDNSELSLALGYNGLGRLTGNAFSFLNGGATLSNTISDLSPTSLGFTRGETGAPGAQRLINAELGGQASWLLMLAIFGLIAGAWQRRVRVPLDRQQQALVLWGGWLFTVGAFFSVAGFFHAYYLVTLAPPVAALAGIAVVTLWQDYRRPGTQRAPRGWALPLALVASAAVEAAILSNFPDWSGWLTPLVVGSSLLLGLVLVALRLCRRVAQPIAVAALGLGVVALLLPSSIWSEYTVANASGGLVPSAGPAGRGGFGDFGGGRRFRGPGRRFPIGGGSPREGAPFGGAGPQVFVAGGGGFGDDSRANQALIRYLEAHQGRAKFLVATPNAGAAEPFILATGKPVMALGGFMSDRILDVQQLASVVSRGTVRYFLLPSGGADRGAGFFGRLPEKLRTYLRERGRFPGRFRGFRGGFGPGGNGDLTQWVSRHCSVVPASAYGSVSSSFRGGFPGGQQLYDCRS